MSENVYPPQVFRAGSRIAGYLLEEQIGQGGMAVVFRAHDERLDRTVALKILAPGLEQDQAFRQRFVRESRAAAAVDDPHIIPVFEAGEAGGVLFIAMRFVRGGDVRSLVDRVGPLPPGQAAEIISPVASALDAAHDAGLVHRDVKPANMLLDSRSGRPDHVYLSDFGLTKGALLATGLTETGQFLGTLDYTAPEQIEGKHVDGRADQYALACAAFELLTGQPPFRRAEAMAVMRAHLSEPPPRLTSRRPELPGGVDAVFARALSKVPADRFGTCREFSEALRRALGINSYDSGPSMPPLASWPPTELAGPAPGPTDHDADGYAPDRSVRATQVDDHTDLRPPGPGRPGPVPARRSRRGALVLTAAGTAIAAIAAVIVALAARGTDRGPGPDHSSTPPQVRHYSLLRTLPGPSGNAVIEGIAFSPAGGATAAVADNNGGVYLWNATAGNSATTIAGPGAYGSAALAVAFSPDGTKLAAAFKNGEIVLWRVATGRQIGIVTDPNSGVRGAQAVAFSPDGTMLASGDSNGTTYLWNLADLATGQPTGALADQNPGSQGVQAVAFSPSGGTLASGDSNGTSYVWNLSSQNASLLPDPGAGSLGIQVLAFSPDGRLLATADYTGRAIVWNVAARTSVTFTVPDSAGYGAVAVAISHDGAALAVGDGNGTTYLWNLGTRQAAGSLADENGRGVQAVAFSRDDNVLATGDINGTTYVWQAG